MASTYQRYQDTSIFDIEEPPFTGSPALHALQRRHDQLGNEFLQQSLLGRPASAVFVDPYEDEQEGSDGEAEDQDVIDESVNDESTGSDVEETEVQTADDGIPEASPSNEASSDWDLNPYGGVYLTEEVTALVQGELDEETWSRLVAAKARYVSLNALAEKVFPALQLEQQDEVQSAVDISDSAAHYLETVELALSVALGYRPVTGSELDPETGSAQPVALEQEGMAEEDVDQRVDQLVAWVALMEDANDGLAQVLDEVDAEQVSNDVDVQWKLLSVALGKIGTTFEYLDAGMKLDKVRKTVEEVTAHLESIPSFWENFLDRLNHYASQEVAKEVVGEILKTGIGMLFGVGELTLAAKLIRTGILVSAKNVAGGGLELVFDAVPDSDTPLGSTMKASSKLTGMAKTRASFLAELTEHRTIVQFSKILTIIGHGEDVARIFEAAILDEGKREAVASRLESLRSQVPQLELALFAASKKFKALVEQGAELEADDHLGLSGSFLDPSARYLQHRVGYAPDLVTPTGE